MANDILRLKNDILNELRNEKYYINDEITLLANNENITQKEKVKGIIDTVERLLLIDSKINLVDSIFYVPEAESKNESVNKDTPTNIVESFKPNNGQTHSE